MSKKMYETPLVEINTFENESNVSLQISAIQSSFGKTSATVVGNTNVIDF